MITEIAVLLIKPNKEKEFEKSFSIAQEIISASPGYIEHELCKCLEVVNKYVLIVRWNKLEDHTIGFRQSEAYKEWKELLHHFYDPFPIVEHFENAF